MRLRWPRIFAFLMNEDRASPPNKNNCVFDQEYIQSCRARRHELTLGKNTCMLIKCIETIPVFLSRDTLFFFLINESTCWWCIFAEQECMYVSLNRHTLFIDKGHMRFCSTGSQPFLLPFFFNKGTCIPCLTRIHVCLSLFANSWFFLPIFSLTTLCCFFSLAPLSQMRVKLGGRAAAKAHIKSCVGRSWRVFFRSRNSKLRVLPLPRCKVIQMYICIY